MKLAENSNIMLTSGLSLTVLILCSYVYIEAQRSSDVRVGDTEAQIRQKNRKYLFMADIPNSSGINSEAKMSLLSALAISGIAGGIMLGKLADKVFKKYKNFKLFLLLSLIVFSLVYICLVEVPSNLFWDRGSLTSQKNQEVIQVTLTVAALSIAFGTILSNFKLEDKYPIIGRRLFSLLMTLVLILTSLFYAMTTRDGNVDTTFTDVNKLARKLNNTETSLINTSIVLSAVCVLLKIII